MSEICLSCNYEFDSSSCVCKCGYCITLDSFKELGNQRNSLKSCLGAMTEHAKELSKEVETLKATERFLVEADHPIMSRPDRRFVSLGDAGLYMLELGEAGFENIKISCIDT